MSDEATLLKLSAMRALREHVTPPLRSASIQKDGFTIRWRCNFDSDATEDDYELARIAGTEIIADFSGDCDIREEILITPYPEEAEDLEFLIFRRHEPNP